MRFSWINVKRVRKKLCSLLCNNSTTLKPEWVRRHRLEIALNRLQKHNPEKYYDLEIRLIHDLEALENALEN